MQASKAAVQSDSGRAAFYSINRDESERIQLWRLWMVFFMPLRHVYSTAFRAGGAGSASIVEPEWLQFIQYILTEIMPRFVPSAFALIAAVLLFRKPFDYGKNVVRKLKSLMLPLFLLTSFWVALYAIGPHIPGLGKLFSSETTRVADWSASQWFAAYLGWTPEHQIPTLLYPLWFLRDLMVMNLIAPAIKWVIDRIPRIFLGVLALLLIWKTESRFYFHTIHQIFIFFCLGYYVVKYDLHFSHLDRISWKWIGGLYVLSIAGAYLLRDYADAYSAVRGIPNLMGVLFFAKFMSKLPASPKWRRRFLWLAEYNVAIYLFHERILTFAKKLMLRVLPASLPSTLLLFYGLPVIICALCVGIGWFLRKYQPRVYGLFTGSR